MPRRFELALAPVLARLGLTRPDENPLAISDDVRPIVQLGDYRLAAPSPGSRWMRFGSSTVGPFAGNFAAHRFTAPPGGCWILSLVAMTDAGDWARWGTSQHIGTPALTVAGSNATTARLDFREPAFAPAMSQGFVAGIPGGARRASPQQNLIRSPFPVWWQQGQGTAGTDIWVFCEIADEGMEVELILAEPLEDVRRVVE